MTWLRPCNRGTTIANAAETPSDTAPQTPKLSHAKAALSGFLKRAKSAPTTDVEMADWSPRAPCSNSASIEPPAASRPASPAGSAPLRRPSVATPPHRDAATDYASVYFQ